MSINRRGMVGPPGGCDDFVSLNGTVGSASMPPGVTAAPGQWVRIVMVDEATCPGSGTPDDLIEVYRGETSDFPAVERIGACNGADGRVCNILAPAFP